MGLFKNIVSENEQFNEAFNQPPYEYTFGKKNATEVFFTFQEEGEDKEYRIMFAASSGVGKNVRRIFIGERVGTSNTVRNVIKKFKNPMRVIGTLTAAVEEFLMTPMGMKIDGFAIFIPAIAGNRLDEFMKLLFKRNAKIRSKLVLIDTKLKLDEKGFYLWTVRKGKNPTEVFTGEQVSGMFPDQTFGGDEPASPQQNSSNTYLSPDEVVEKLYANLKGDGYEIDIQRSIMGKESVYVKTGDIRSVITVRATNEKVFMVVPVLNDKFESSWSMINANLTLLIGRIRKVELVGMQSEEPADTPTPQQTSGIVETINVPSISRKYTVGMKFNKQLLGGYLAKLKDMIGGDGFIKVTENTVEVSGNLFDIEQVVRPMSVARWLDQCVMEIAQYDQERPTTSTKALNREVTFISDDDTVVEFVSKVEGDDELVVSVVVKK